MLQPLDMNNEINSQSHAGESQGSIDCQFHHNEQLPVSPQTPKSTASHLPTNTSSPIDFSTTPGINISIDSPPLEAQSSPENIPTYPAPSNTPIYQKPRHSYARQPSYDNMHTMLSRTKAQTMPLPSVQSLAVVLKNDLQEPKNVKEALLKPNWTEAMAEEMQALKTNVTWH